MKSVAAKTSTGLLTYQEYLTFPDSDGLKKEIIEGDLYMTPAPSIKHQQISSTLFYQLFIHVAKNKLGKVLYAPCDVLLSNINVLQPDIIFIARENYDILTEYNIQGAPDLLIEILSPSTQDTDRIFKKRIYEKFGVKEYWILDPILETVEIWSSTKNKYQLLINATKDDTIESRVIAGLRLALVTVFDVE